MKTAIKILLGLLLILMAAVVLIGLFVDPNDFKDEIRARVAQATSRELTLDGDLGLSVFPWVGIQVREASLSQPPGFGAGPFLSIREAQLRARLLPLLRGRLAVDELRGTGLTLNLVRESDGRTNWADLAGISPGGPREMIAPPVSRDSGRAIPAPSPQEADVEVLSPAPSDLGGSLSAARFRGPLTTPALPEAESPRPHSDPPQPGSETPSDPSPSPLTDLAIAGIAFDQVRITLDDRQIGAQLTFDGLSVSTGPLSRAAPLDLHLAGDVAERGTGLSAHLVLDTSLTLAANGRDLTTAPFDLRLERLALRGGGAGTVSLSGKLMADLAAHRYRLPDLLLEAAVRPLSGRLVPIKGKADLDLDLTAGTFQLSGLSLDSGELRLHAEATGTGLLRKPALRGRLELAKLDLRAWLERHGLPVPETADPKALTVVAMQADWSMAAGRLDLEPLSATLDGTQITGKASLTPGVPAGYGFDLAADTLDLDAYLPPAARSKPPAAAPGSAPIPPPSATSAPPASASSAPPKTESSPTSSVSPPSSEKRPPDSAAAPMPNPVPGAVVKLGSGGSAGLFPVRFIRGLDLQGKVRIARLRAFGMALEGVSADVAAENGRLAVENRIEGFYQGRLQGHVRLEADLDPPKLVLVQQANGIEAGPLLQDLAGEGFVTGRGRFGADLQTAGQTPDILKRNLSGQAAMQFSMGSIKGFNLEQMIRQAEAKLKGKPAPPPGLQQTDFTDLRASADVKNGIFSNNDLSAASTYLQASGNGSADIVNERLDYRLELVFVDPPEGRGIKEIEDIPIPLRVTGSFERPDWNIELTPVLRELAKRKLKETLDKESDSGLKRLEERTGIKGLEKGLRQLFNF